MKNFFFFVALMVVYAAGDLYMQNPRGSNGRLNEANTNRNNGNRLMDTQNNAKGGYCVGPAMGFYEGSRLAIEWTNQHGCANPKLYCNLVIQYMCGERDANPLVRIRDGTTTNTIPDSVEGATELDGEALRYGMHESYRYYQNCKSRSRNMGLFIADREEEGGLGRNRRSAIFTRQNNNGNRHGYECVEERDYYPYWHPSPWKDVAILTENTDWCGFYRGESQNRKSKNYCASREEEAPGVEGEEPRQLRYNSEAECTTNDGIWREVPSFGIGAPDCVQAPWSRDNHLGNSMDGFANTYNWTIPRSGQEDCIDNDNCACVLRMRYNISTGDLGSDGNRPDSRFVDYRNNAAQSPVLDDEIVEYEGHEYQLAIDTTQFGRTFQDRSHVFHIRPRPNNIPGLARVFNLNVRGKRGNIVQTYPATEYDFAPTYLNIRVGDYVHFQWTGCDTNPNGNAGEGTAGTDRSNIIQIENLAANKPASDAWMRSNSRLFSRRQDRERMAFLDQENCLTYEQLLEKNDGNQGQAEQDVQNCMLLNAAPTPYFDGKALEMGSAGTHYFMSSRNNNFSNRGQKGTLVVEPLLSTAFVALVSVGAGLFVASGGIGAAILYGKANPSSSVGTFLAKF